MGVAELEASLASLQAAKRLFRELSAAPDAVKEAALSVEATKLLVQHADWCADSEDVALGNIEDAKERQVRAWGG